MIQSKLFLVLLYTLNDLEAPGRYAYWEGAYVAAPSTEDAALAILGDKVLADSAQHIFVGLQDVGIITPKHSVHHGHMRKGDYEGWLSSYVNVGDKAIFKQVK